MIESFVPPSSAVNILLVDDSDSILVAFEAVLDGLGATVAKATTGGAALDWLTEHDCAVVLLDVRIPDLDGFEVARRIRATSKHRETPIIFVTGFEETRISVEKAYSLGAVDYLVKPIHPVVLRAKVVGFIDLYRKSERLRQQSDQLARESEQRFSGFMRHLPGLAWIKDARGRYVYANDAALKAFQLSREDLYGKSDMDVFPVEIATQFMEHDRRALAVAAGIQVVETLQHTDGLLHHSLVNKFPIPSVDGTPSLIGGMAIDITDRLKAEEALREADRLKDEFLAMLAHELRNPLAPIRNAIHVMKQPELTPEIQQEMLTLAERQVQHMARLLDDLLDVSRLSRGMIGLRTQHVELATVVDRSVEAIRSSMDEKQHRLSITVPAESIRVDGDPARLEQILTNLLSNAAKYTDPGGHVWLKVERNSDQVTLRVSDSGIGISAETLPRVFDLFVQGERRLERSRGGVGIGLTLVKKLVELHGGTVQAQSAGPGQGSAFTVRLPVESTPNEFAPTGTESTDADLIRPSQRILVVDDNRDAADSFALLLRGEGQIVQVAYEGHSAVDTFQAFQPEIVFLDLGMPEMDGYEIAKKIRAAETTDNVVLVALTGWGQEGDKQRTREAGFDHHLVKPAEPDLLRALLRGPLHSAK